jgi:TP901 family phage tail tape measure protein
MSTGGKFEVETIFKAVDRMSAVLDKMEKKTGKFSSGMQDGLKKLDAFNSKVSSGIKATAGFAAAASVAAGAVAVNSIEAGMAFEQQIANLGAAYLKTRSQIVDLEKKSMELGASTQFSATEVAHAMEEMAKAGFTEEQALGGIEGMTYAAAAAGEDLIETTANVSAVMKGMQIDVSQSIKVADVLTLASVKTASSISSLGESLSKAGPVAQQFGVDLIDVTAMVAKLQDAGIDASEAGSATATMLTKLATPTDAIRAKMKKLGVSFETAAGNMKSPAEVLAELSKASVKSGGNMKKAAFFAELLGLRGQKAGILLEKSFASGKYTELVEELKKAEGKAKEMAGLRMNTLTGDLDVFMENVKGLQVELFTLNSGPLRDVVKSTTAWLDANKDVIVAEIQDGIRWLIDNLPKIVTWLERIAIGIAVFTTFAVLVKGVAFAIEAYEAAVVIATGVQWLFTNSITATRVAVEAFQALNAAAHMSKTGMAINGIQSKLGQAGLLMAVGAVGYAFGSWLNETFGLDEKISGWIAGLTDIEDKLNEMGGRAKGPGLEKGGDQYLSDGSVKRADGTWALKSDARKKKEADAAKFADLKGSGNMFDGVAPTPVLFNSAPSNQSQMVTPQERTARSISESTETTKAEITLKDETGSAQVTKPPKAKNVSIKLQPSGQF